MAPRNAVRFLLGVMLCSGLGAGQTYTIHTVAGGGLPEEVPALTVGLGRVNGVAVDSAGNLYLALWDYNAVVRVDRQGILTLVAGGGIAGSAGDGGLAAKAQLNQPTGLAVDAAGNLYVAENRGGRVRKISKGIINTVAGGGTNAFGATVPNGDGGPAVGASMAPAGIAIDSAGNLYIADVGNRSIRKVSNGIITTVAGTWDVSHPTQDNMPATDAVLFDPVGVAVDSAGNFYIAQHDMNSTVRKVSNGMITTVAGTTWLSGYRGDNGPATSAVLDYPTYLAVDGAGNLYIMDAYNDAVRKVSNGIITTVAGNPQWEGYYGNAGPATDAILNFSNGCAGGDLPCPWVNGGIAVDSGGNVYFADYANLRVRKIQNGIITTVAGNGTAGFDEGDGGSATSAQFADPKAIAVDGAGALYVSDTWTNRIRKVAQGIITNVAGTGATGFAGDGGPATSAELALCGYWVPGFLGGCIHGVGGVAANGAGELFLSDVDNSRIRKVDRNGTIRTVAGIGTKGYSGDGGPALAAQLSGDAGFLASDAAGAVYIQDGQARIRKLALDGTISTVAGNGSMGFSGDGGPATSAQINAEGIAFDPVGNLYIADWGTERVRKVDQTGTITTFAGTGHANFAGDNGPAVNADLFAPAAVAADGAGNVFITDSGNNRVRRVDASGIITTIAGGGSVHVAEGPALDAELNGPSGLAVDATGNVYVADSGNYVVRVLVPQDDSCAYSLGQTSFATAAEGGLLSVSVETAPSCSWMVSGMPFWITSNAVGRGPATVSLAVAANRGAARTANLAIGGAEVVVSQDGAACVFSIDPYNAAFPRDGGTGTANVTAAPGCSWTAASTVDWVTLTSAGGGTGSGIVSFAVAPNGGSERSGAVTIAGRTFTVEQATSLLPHCQYYVNSLDQVTFTVPKAGATETVSLQTMSLCPWSLSGVPDWIAAPAVTGQGPGPVTLLVDPNPGPRRSATLVLSGVAVTVQQDAADCETARLDFHAGAFAARGGTDFILVNVCTGSTWVASTTSDWISLERLTGPTGEALGYTVARNTGAARTGTIMISGTPFTVQQVSASAAAGRFVPVTPCRVADTRNPQGPFGGPTPSAASIRSFPITQSACGIPATAQAYALNVTVVPQGYLGYLTLWPAGQAQPLVSTLNSWEGEVVANAAIVPAGDGGSVSVFVTDATDVVLDINGYFDSSSNAGSYAFYTAPPCRIADTREAAGPLGGPSLWSGESRDFPVPSGACNIPSSAAAYSLNVTAVPHDTLGFLSVWPWGSPWPNVSTLNSWTGKVVANAALVPAGANGSVAVYATDPTDVILDINGYFAQQNPPGGLSFYPVPPCRVADTRNPDGPLGGPIMEAATARSFKIQGSGCFVPEEAQAYSVNITVVPEGPLPYLTVWPGPTSWAPPLVSTLNSFDGSVVANAAIVPSFNWTSLSVFASARTHVVIDINGYFGY